MMNITWFNKEQGARPVNPADITIRKSSKTGVYSILVRNGNADLMSETGYIRLGVSEEDRNILVFMAASKKDGWKLAQYNNHPDIKIAQFYTGKILDLLARFEGDYNLDITEDNLFYLNRKEML